jgi:hypothetical protein
MKSLKLFFFGAGGAREPLLKFYYRNKKVQGYGNKLLKPNICEILPL